MDKEVKWFKNTKEARSYYSKQESNHGVEFTPIEAKVDEPAVEKEPTPKKKSTKKKADVDD